MVMQPTDIPWVGGSNPGLVNLTPPPPPKVSRPGFEPQTLRRLRYHWTGGDVTALGFLTA